MAGVNIESTDNIPVADKTAENNTHVDEVPPTEWELTINTFIKKQESVLSDFLKSQKNFLVHLGNGKKRKRSNNEETLDLNTSGSLVDEDRNSEDGDSNGYRESDEEAAGDDPLANYSRRGDSQGVNADSNDDHTGKGSRYQDLLESTAEIMGQPIEQELANVCGKIWGQAKYTEKHKDELKKILVPENILAMKTPRLNQEIYGKLSDNVTDKDKAVGVKCRNYNNRFNTFVFKQ